MHWFRFSFLVLVTALIQGSGLGAYISLQNGARPDFLLILMVFFALHCYSYEAVISSFAIGLAADLVAGTLGPYLVSFGFCGVILSCMRQFIAIKRTLHVIAAVLFTGLMAVLLAQILGYFKGHGWPNNGLALILGIAVYSGLLAPYLFSGLLAIIDWLGVRKYHVR